MLKNKKNFFRKGYFYIFIAIMLFGYFLWVPQGGVYDWSKELYYLQFIRDSFLRFGQFPYIWWDRSPIIAYPAVSQSAIFLSNPETMLFSPFIFLLIFVNSVMFVKVVVFIHMIIGLIGSFLLKQRLSWEDAQFRVFLILFLFSPIIMQHICIGYTPWLNLFYFPLFFYFSLEEKLVKQSVGLAMVLSIVLLQGGVHVLVWMVAYLTLLTFLKVIFQKKPVYLLVFLITGIWSLILSFVRVIYSAGTFGVYEQEISSGYRLSNFFTWAVKINHFPERSTHYIENILHGIGFWDGAIYWGPALFLLIFFLVIAPNLFLKPKKDETVIVNYFFPVFLTAIILLVFSFYDIYAFLVNTVDNIFHIPFLKGAERYAYRFAIPAYFGLAFVLSHFIFQIRNKIYVVLRKILFVLFDHDFIRRYWKASVSSVRNINDMVCNNWENLVAMREHSIFRFLRFSWIGFVIGFVLYAVSKIFFEPINQLINMQVSAAYYEHGFVLITRLMENKDVIPLEIYIQKFTNKFAQIQNVLLGLSVLFLIIYFIQKNYASIEYYFQQNIRIMADGLRKIHDVCIVVFELLIILPLLYSIWMWTWLGTSTKQDEFNALTYQITPPIVESISNLNHEEIEVYGTPTTLTIYQKSIFSDYFLPEIPSSDFDELMISSENAIIQKHWGGVLIKPFGNGDVIIKVREDKFYQSLSITLFAWTISIIFMVVPGRRSIP